jgi:hypothetical protein
VLIAASATAAPQQKFPLHNANDAATMSHITRRQQLLQLEDSVHAGHALGDAHLLPQAARRCQLRQVPPQVGPLVAGRAAGVLLVQLPGLAVHLRAPISCLKVSTMQPQ